jgi:putative DNA primase/helicase
MDKKAKQRRLKQATDTLKWCLNSESAPRVNAALDLARSEPNVPVVPEELDQAPWLFNCVNGTIDLKSGLLLPHRRELLITKLCPTAFDPEATCPAWEKFLRDVFRGKKREGQPEPQREEETEQLITFVQRLSGRFLTGDVSEQLLPIFWGIGANGKSTFINAT